VIRRAHVLIALTLTLIFGFAAPAFGWANGGDDGNGYGTHDWILDEALRLAGTSGSWVNRSVALATTDDPDSAGVPGNYHMFREQGTARGAPSQTATYYLWAVQAYRAGDRAAASRYLGVLSHYYSDVLQPFHTAYAARNYEALHLSYEYRVDDYQHRAGNVRWWITPAARRPVTDIRARVVEAGKFSRSYYDQLFPAWKSTQHVGNVTVFPITKALLSRAVNDLADVIATIPTGQGCALAPAQMTSAMFRAFPAQKMNAHVLSTCLDATGAPIEGAAVRVDWAFPGGTVQTVAFTDADGVADALCNVGTARLMRWIGVATYSFGSNGTARGATRFMPTPTLAEGRSGISTTVADTRPHQHTVQTATTGVRDAAGRAVAGLPVTFYWQFKSGTFACSTVTNSAGVAVSRWNLGAATLGYRVYVKAQTQSGGYDRSSIASFVPQ